MKASEYKRSWAEPYRMKMVELLKTTTRQQRLNAIKKAGFNTFLLPSEDVYIDLLTDSGTSAMSDQQWSAFMMGDEAYAGSKSFERMEAAIQKHYGYKYIIPTHQGRGAENLLSKIMIKPGQYVPGNMYFTTTRLHQELAGGIFHDIIIDEAHDPNSLHPFKGNVDLNKLEALVKKHGARQIAYLSVATNVNMAGGQPISLENLRELRVGSVNFPHDPEWTSGVNIAHDVDLLFHDAQFRPEEYLHRIGWGHSSIEDAILFARMCKVKKLSLFHHDPAHTDTYLDNLLKEFTENKTYPFEVEMCAEGNSYFLGSAK
jgi:hypothetical protein